MVEEDDAEIVYTLPAIRTKGTSLRLMASKLFDRAWTDGSGVGQKARKVLSAAFALTG